MNSVIHNSYLTFWPKYTFIKKAPSEAWTPDLFTGGEHLSKTPLFLLKFTGMPCFITKDFIFTSSSACHLLILFLFLILQFLLMDRSGIQLDIVDEGGCCQNDFPSALIAKPANLCTCAYIHGIVCFSSTQWCENLFDEEWCGHCHFFLQ